MFLTAAGIAVALVLGLKILVLLVEPRLTFMPVRELPVTPGDLELPFEDASITTDDHLRIHGWFVPAPAHEDRGALRRPLTLLFFHGNAENIAFNLPLVELAHRAGHGLLLVDYRGYGTSEGSPSEAGIYRDGEAALRYLRGRPDVDPGRIVVWGRSIGAAVAVHLVAGGTGSGSGAPVAGVVLESPFTSALELLREGGHWILYPAALLGSYRFDSARLIGRIAAPLCVVHGTEDEVAPFRLGRRLYDLAAARKELVAIEGGGHNDLMARHGDELWAGVSRFLATLD